MMKLVTRKLNFIWCIIVGLLMAAPLGVQAASFIRLGPATPTVVNRIPPEPRPLEPGVPAVVPTPEVRVIVPPTGAAGVCVPNPFVASSISFIGNTVISQEDLQDASDIKPGTTVTQDILNKAVANIESAYQDRGYVGTVAEVTLPPGQSGAVIFRIQEMRITEVRLEGLHQVREDAVRRILRVRSGQLYNRGAVVRDLIRLQQLGVFDDISSDLVALQPPCAALVWTFKEKPKFNFVELGGSLGPQEGLLGTGQLILGNLRGRGERLSIISSISSVEGQLGGSAEYFMPWIAPPNTSALFSIYSAPRYRFSRDISTSSGRYSERHSGFRTLINQEWSQYTTGEYGIRAESVNVSDLPLNLFTSSTSQDGTIATGHLRTISDHRNSNSDPTGGTYTVGFLEGGVADMKADGINPIGKLWGDRRWYIPLRNQPRVQCVSSKPPAVPVLALRGLLGVTGGNLPFYEQYFVGGIGDLPLRGYVEDRFWGKYVFLANVELRWPLFKNVTGVAFVDAGDAWGSKYQFAPGEPTGGFEQHKNFSPRAGIGVGIRYATPAGPVRLDFAQGDAFRIHFSIGQVF